MARLKCKCRNSISNVIIPNEIEYVASTLNDWIENETAYESKEPLIRPKYDVWKCDKCRRLHIFESGKEGRIALYKIDEE